MVPTAEGFGQGTFANMAAEAAAEAFTVRNRGTLDWVEFPVVCDLMPIS